MIFVPFSFHPKVNGASEPVAAPAPAPTPAVAMGQPAIAASELEEEDAKALQEMLLVMNRKPHEAGGKAMCGLIPFHIFNSAGKDPKGKVFVEEIFRLSS